VSVAEDDEVGARVNGTLSTAEAASGKYGHDGIGWYIKKGYKEPAQAQPGTETPAYGRQDPSLSPSGPIDSVARGTGLGKASMLPSKAGKYSFARPMGSY